jgi:hypothetical protein
MSIDHQSKVCYLEGMKMEQWKDIEGFEGIYKVSSKGRVWSYAYGSGKERRFSITNRGYALIILQLHGKVYKGESVHRLVAKAFIPNPEGKATVNHIDGNKLNNSVENLEWVTQKDNVKHAYRTGLKKGLRGENNPSAMLTEEQVIEIRGLVLSQEKIASMYGVTRGCIKGIKENKTWRYLV